MSKPFDAATKFLIDLSPRDWLALAGVTPEPNAVVETFDADLSTISADADRLIRVSNITNPCLYHIELQASYDARFDERVFWYNSLARYEYKMPVRSVAFLLRKAADGPNIRGMIDDTDGVHQLRFGYTTVRLWQQSAQDILKGGLAALPLAPLAAQSRQEVADIVYAVHNRLYAELDVQKARDLSTATFILLGLSYDDAFLQTLTQGIQKMQESSFYQMILREGRNEGLLLGRDEGVRLGQIEEARRTLLLQGTRRFGEPSAVHRAQIEAARTLEQLEVWLLSVLDAPNWDGLFR